jgi:hypothetical protein
MDIEAKSLWYSNGRDSGEEEFTPARKPVHR